MIGKIVAGANAVCEHRKIDVSYAPSGATHWSDSGGYFKWFKYSNDEWFYWSFNCWLRHFGEVPSAQEVLYPIDTKDSKPSIDVGSEWFVGVDGELYKTKIVGRFVVGKETFAHHVRKGDVDLVHLTTDPSIFIALDDYKAIDRFLKESQIRKMVNYLCGEGIVGNPSRETITQICEELVAANLVKID